MHDDAAFPDSVENLHVFHWSSSEPFACFETMGVMCVHGNRAVRRWSHRELSESRDMSEMVSAWVRRAMMSLDCQCGADVRETVDGDVLRATLRPLEELVYRSVGR